MAMASQRGEYKPVSKELECLKIRTVVSLSKFRAIHIHGVSLGAICIILYFAFLTG
jgi:hypothetical protein